MLQINVPIEKERWDEKRQEFVEPKVKVLTLEHSLISLSKWESKWCKPFLTNEDKTYEETIDYIKCMTLTPNIDPEVYNYLTVENVLEINKYIEAPMTATTFGDNRTFKSNREIVTSELIYYWMIALQIPPEYQKWHLNRLLTLIRICTIKNSPSKKMSKAAILSRNAELNAARRTRLNSKG